MSVFFAQNNIKGAKQYFLQELEKRPDVLMEASDIHGELKLCMQIISTCEYEQKRAELTMLDRGMDFEELLKVMKELNRFIEHLDETEAALQIQEYVSKHPVSATAAEIAAVVAGKSIS